MSLPVFEYIFGCRSIPVLVTHDNCARHRGESFADDLAWTGYCKRQSGLVATIRWDSALVHRFTTLHITLTTHHTQHLTTSQLIITSQHPLRTHPPYNTTLQHNTTLNTHNTHNTFNTPNTTPLPLNTCAFIATLRCDPSDVGRPFLTK